MKRRMFFKSAAAASMLPMSLNGMSLRTYGKESLLGVLGKRGISNDKVLVIIQLNGGNDGLNMLVPLDQYTNLSKARANILLDEKKVLSLNGTAKTGLHPKMTGLQNMFNNGLVNAIQGIGYPQPNFSHFRATDIWMSASDSDKFVTTGWMGRYLDKRYTNYPKSYPNSTMPDPVAIQIGSLVSLNFMGPSVSMGMAISDPNSFYNLVDGNTGSTGSTPKDLELAYIRELTQQTNQYTTVVKNAAGKGKNLSTKYGTGNNLADQLKIVAKLISGGLKTPVYMVSLGGFDTHSSQVDNSDTSAGTHALLMQKLSDGIAAFQDDLKLLGISERVVGMTFSEFGRRIQSNASGGTDHGAAAPMIVFGEAVQPGIIGNSPIIPSSTTVNDNVPMQFDFRQVYASVLQDWLEVPSSDVKSLMNGIDYNTLPIFKSNPMGIEDIADLMTQIEISGVWPNPATDFVKVEFVSDGGGKLGLSVYNPLGQRVYYIEPKEYGVGQFEVEIDLRDMRKGNYVIQLNANKKSISRMLVVG
jgi:uncharacterized protein (DUF1501 family)